MKIETRWVSYWTANKRGERLLPVDGEALKLPPPWDDLRLCVRRMSPVELLYHYAPKRRTQRSWRIDHYPTGCNLDLRVPPAASKAAAIYALLLWLRTAPEFDLQVLRADNLADIVAITRRAR